MASKNALTIGSGNLGDYLDFSGLWDCPDPEQGVHPESPPKWLMM